MEYKALVLTITLLCCQGVLWWTKMAISFLNIPISGCKNYVMVEDASSLKVNVRVQKNLVILPKGYNWITQLRPMLCREPFLDLPNNLFKSILKIHIKKGHLYEMTKCDKY
jgi:hypothetical protein